MTAQSDPYVRVYYRIVEDDKFANVYDDKATLGWWLTLLLAADATYPAPANLPRRLPNKVLDTLVSSGLVELAGSDRYRIHGLSSERDHRSESSRFAAEVKAHGLVEAQRRQSERKAGAVRAQSGRSAERVPLRTEPLRTEPNLSNKNGLKPIGELLPGVVERLVS